MGDFFWLHVKTVSYWAFVAVPCAGLAAGVLDLLGLGEGYGHPIDSGGLLYYNALLLFWLLFLWLSKSLIEWVASLLRRSKTP